MDRPDRIDEPVARAARRYRWLFNTAGCLCVGLGIVGVVLPVLPTTPFMLLAAACFSRGSERLHGWLLGTRLFGPTIRAWQETRSIPTATKITAIALMVTVLGSTILLVISHPALRITLTAIGVGVIVVLLRIPSRPRDRVGAATVVVPTEDP